jgi:hypothetical protein
MLEVVAKHASPPVTTKKVYMAPRRCFNCEFGLPPLGAGSAPFQFASMSATFISDELQRNKNDAILRGRK